MSEAAPEIMIENVTQFVEEVSKIAKNSITTNDQTEFFYRGHADRAYKAEPAIFRNPNHLANEKEMFNDIITQCPEDFKDCQYTFEYLVKMQHYGLPTRLLDVTSNALVALYFACCSLNDFMRDGKGNILYNEHVRQIDNRKDGQVLVYKVWQGAIKNYNSDTVSVLSNLAQLDSDFEVWTDLKRSDFERLFALDQELKQRINFSHYLTSSIKKYQELLSIAQQEHSEMDVGDDQVPPEDQENLKIIKKIIPLVQPVLHESIGLLDIELQLMHYNGLSSEKERFLHFIKQEKSYFIDKIEDDSHVQKIVCVRAKLNNPRIIKQSGLFFLFGMGNKKGNPISFDEYIYPSIREIITPKIIISGKAKKEILKELRTFGISSETLMPEIDHVAQSIKERYSHL